MELGSNYMVAEAALRERPELIQGLTLVPDWLINSCFTTRDDPRLPALLDNLTWNVILSLKGSEVLRICDFLVGRTPQFHPGTGELDIGLMPLDGPGGVYHLLKRAGIDLTGPDISVNPPRTNPSIELIRLLKEGKTTAELYFHFAHMGSVTGDIHTEARQSPLTALSMRVLITPWGSFLYDPFDAMTHWVKTDCPIAQIPDPVNWPSTLTLAIPYGAAAIAWRGNVANVSEVMAFWREKVNEFDQSCLTPQAIQAVREHHLKLTRSLKTGRGQKAVTEFNRILTTVGFYFQ